MLVTREEVLWGGETSCEPLCLFLMTSPAHWTQVKSFKSWSFTSEMFCMRIQRMRSRVWHSFSSKLTCRRFAVGWLGTIHSLGLPLFVPVYCFIFLSQRINLRGWDGISTLWGEKNPQVPRQNQEQISSSGLWKLLRSFDQYSEPSVCWNISLKSSNSSSEDRRDLSFFSTHMHTCRSVPVLTFKAYKRLM